MGAGCALVQTKRMLNMTLWKDESQSRSQVAGQGGVEVLVSVIVSFGLEVLRPQVRVTTVEMER